MSTTPMLSGRLVPNLQWVETFLSAFPPGPNRPTEDGPGRIDLQGLLIIFPILDL